MFAESGLMFPYFQNFSQEVHQLEEYCRSHKSNVPMGNLIETCTISDYDLGGEGDLFKAPEPMIEEPAVDLDPMTGAISMLSCGEDVISPQTVKAADIESIQSEQLQSEVFYECKKDLLAKDAIVTPLTDVLDIKIPPIGTDNNLIPEENLNPEGSFQKSVSSGCLRSMEWVHGAPLRPNFLDFPGMDLSDVYVIRRAFSEGLGWALILNFYDRLLVMARLASSILPLGCHPLAAVVPKTANKSFPDTGTRRQRGILAGKSSMLAGRLWQIVSQGFAEGLQRQKNQTFQRKL